MNKELTFAIGVFGIAAIAFSILRVEGKPSEKPYVNDKRFHGQLLEIADSYTKNYKRVDDRMMVVSALCTPPTTPPPGLRLSQSKDAATHGQKMYYLYAKDELAYRKLNAQAVGQAIVKEAWEPSKNLGTTPTVKNALFIMAKLDSKTKGTDDGWIYGTVTADGKTVTSSGRVETCMSCHTSAPHGRLFGVKPEE